MKLTKLATAAAWMALQRIEIKGRLDALLFASVTRALKSGAMRPNAAEIELLAKTLKIEPSQVPVAEVGNYDFVGGDVALNEVELAYFDRVVTDVLNAGVSAQYGLGFGELVEVLSPQKAQ
jgi:hypothetical protein